MTLHVGTLKFPSIGTESICITILQDGEVYCLTSAVCLAAYFKDVKRLEDGNIDWRELLHDETLSAQLTDIRSLAAFSAISSGQKLGQRSCKNSEGDRLESNSGKKLEMVVKRDVCLKTVKSDLTENEESRNETNILSSKCDKKADLVMVTDHKTRRETDQPLFTYEFPSFSSLKYDNIPRELQSVRGPISEHLSIENSVESIENIVVKPCHIYTVPKTEQTLRRVFQTQDFKINDFDKHANELFFQLASTVLIFGTCKNNLLPMLQVLQSSLSPVTQGDPVLVLSNPFSFRPLRYSWSTGILSSILNQSPVFLTDASVTSCSEGSPVFSYDGRLIGILICSVFRNQSEVINFSMGISLETLRQELASSLSNCSREDTNYTLISRQVPLVRSGSSWGSGVVLDATSGIILTCAHVIGADDEVVVSYLDKRYPASLVFKSDGGSYDLALLATHCELEGALAVKLNSCQPLLGSRVTCAGYPVFNEYALSPLSVTLSSGIISKLHQIASFTESSTGTQSSGSAQKLKQTSNTSHNNETQSSGNHLQHPAVVMLQSNCTVHSGVSGGALLDMDGSLVGLMVCNVKADSTVHPRLNMAVPICAIYATLTKYLTTRDPTVLRSLNVPDPRIRRVWNLEPIRCKL